MSLAKHKPIGPTDTDWLRVVKCCYEEAKDRVGARFAGSWVFKRHQVSPFPNLNVLVSNGVLKKVASTAGEAYYIMPNVGGVEKALKELGCFKNYIR